jgi:hypothetical protein
LQEADPKSGKKYSQAGLGTALGGLSQETIRKAASPDGASRAVLEGVLRLRGIDGAELLARHGQNLDEQTAAVLKAEAATFNLRGGNVGLHVSRVSARGGAQSSTGERPGRGSFLYARQRLVERYPEHVVDHAIATSPMIDADHPGSDLEIYLNLEEIVARQLEREPLSSHAPRSDGPSGGNGGGVRTDGDNPGATVPSNREIEAGLERTEKRFETPKPSDRRQAKARQR